MTNPKAVRAAMIFSIATTGGAMYYFLSDGGDPQKLEQNLADATAKITETGARIAETSARIADTTSKLKETVAAWTTTPEPAQQPSGDKGNSVNTEEQHVSSNESARNTETETRSTDHLPTGDTKCHTCSGPRIWFFAEKLRLKRRMTPYPDPSRE